MNHELSMLVDCAICLTRSAHQLDFLGSITSRRLHRVFMLCDIQDADLVERAVKWILGHEFLTSTTRYRVNFDIASCFIASLLDLGEDDNIVLDLCDHLLHPYFLGSLHVILEVALFGYGIPMP